MKYKPRQAAFEILQRVETRKSFADILINRTISAGNLEGSSAFLTELVYGVLSKQKKLDYVIDQFVKGGKKVKQSLRIILRIGSYQILFLDTIPEFAIVNETVEIAKKIDVHAAGFVNGILRNILRNKQSIKFPDKETNLVEFISVFYSHPKWLVESWIKQLGVDEAKELAEAMSRVPPLTLRANTLKISRDELKLKLALEGIETEPTKQSPDGLVVQSSINISGSAAFKEGLFTVQDESSQLAARLLSPQPGESILDACAAPGGKTTYLAQLMQNKGAILATDINQNKLKMVEEHAKRMGISIVATKVLDASKLTNQREFFDKILIDAPCSGLGVIRRNPETKWWLKPADIKKMVKKQKLILANVSNLLKPGGTLVYATCSTTLDENEQVVEDFLKHHEEFIKEDSFRTWPHQGGADGFYAVKIRKVA